MMNLNMGSLWVRMLASWDSWVVSPWTKPWTVEDWLTAISSCKVSPMEIILNVQSSYRWEIERGKDGTWCCSGEQASWLLFGRWVLRVWLVMVRFNVRNSISKTESKTLSKLKRVSKIWSQNRTRNETRNGPETASKLLSLLYVFLSQFSAYHT